MTRHVPGCMHEMTLRHTVCSQRLSYGRAIPVGELVSGLPAQWWSVLDLSSIRLVLLMTAEIRTGGWCGGLWMFTEQRRSSSICLGHFTHAYTQ